MPVILLGWFDVFTVSAQPEIRKTKHTKRLYRKIRVVHGAELFIIRPSKKLDQILNPKKHYIKDIFPSIYSYR